MKKYTTISEEETEELAASLARVLTAGDVIAFRGGLGAGKTAFTRGLARGLGVVDTVSSPTFALVQEYTGGRLPLFHFDMYRIAGWDDLESTGFYDYMDRGGVMAVEWSEKIENALPEDCITVTIETIDGDTRTITVEGGGRF
ncbi:MAG: tRNA (adenosine(37)-N6)-threonylcarbamoyltransferase complex ATPase subunit type 1 TsaE [Oscillospiraceae bacterium]|jgi:tRNA threonylcarbamoyladenosine biosynthesis protein TsaE|nr:tRNA (adenosine(37)-N6)-threonylcarbamoyltransferase complex ATPase subunit type 1 TsaE [Oscillospiraceae bacterium]